MVCIVKEIIYRYYIAMDAQRRAIQGLTVSLDENRAELASFYRQFGNRLFTDSTDASNAAAPLDYGVVDAWNVLLRTRKADAQTIIDIKTALVRLQELGQFKKELGRNHDEERARYRGQLEQVGKIFYQGYSEGETPSFGEAYALASGEDKAASGLEARRDDLQREISEAGFFGKMVAQFKMAGVSSNLRQRRAKMARILGDGAERLLKDGVVRDRIAEGSLDREAADLFQSVQDTSIKIEEYRTRRESLDGDISAVNAMLEAYGALSNPHRRMDELRGKVRDADKRIDALLLTSAREYCDKFLDEDGASPLGNTGDGHTFSDMGTYSHQLEQVAAFRSSISLMCRKIDVLETMIKIDAIGRNIANQEKNVADYQKKIRQLQDMTESARASIAKAEEELARLREHQKEVEATIPGTID